MSATVFAIAFVLVNGTVLASGTAFASAIETAIAFVFAFATALQSDTGAATFLLSEPVLIVTEADCTQNEPAHPIDDYCQDPRERRHFSKLWLDSYLTYSSSFTPVLKGFLLLGRLS